MVYGRERGGWFIHSLELLGLKLRPTSAVQMSRCFPFPPPGYEIKARNNCVDQQAKENHKEKKNKKEKRDKEKRESKERKDRDRSKDKHKDKKHRKEKHKEKKREKGRDKDNNWTPDDRRDEGQTENHNEEKLRDTRGMAEEVKDSKFTEDLDRRTGDEKMGASQRMSYSFSDSTQRKIENLCGASTSASAIKNEQNNGNEMVGLGSSRVHGRINGLVRPVGNFEGQEMEGKEKPKNKETDNRKGEKHEDRDNEKRNKWNNNRRHKEKEKEKELVGGKDHENKRNAEQKVNWKNDQVDSRKFNPSTLHTNNEKYVCPDKDISKKRKGYEMNGFLHENDIQPNKIPRTAYSSHPYVENGRAMELCHIATDSSNGHQAKSNIKAEVINIVQSKINGTARMQPSSVDLKPRVSVDACQNGGSLKRSHPDSKYLAQIYSVPKMEDWPESDDQECHISADSSIGHQTKSNIRAEVVNNVESKINGTAITQLFSVDLKPSVSVDACQNGGASLKRSHPDSKYLTQIYSVPKMEDWIESDDQEWLFGKDNPLSKIKNTNEIKEPQLVWSETLQIKSADVFALPYVIPY